jgi:polyketide cyclase/dehydrase/lipid transport protein
MPQVKVVSTIRASAPRIWDVIGDFNAMPKWHPAIAESTLEDKGGATLRRLRLGDGGVILEKLEEKNDAERFYTYSIAESPLPIADYRSTIAIRPAADAASSTVEWIGSFKVTDGPETDMERVVHGIYTAGVDNLKRMFGG